MSSRRSKQQFGRVRTVRWGERTLDLDLLLFDDRIIQTSEIEIPHPRINTRRFVLEPLLEVAPGAVDPITKRTFAAILADLDRRPRLMNSAAPVHLPPAGRPFIIRSHGTGRSAAGQVEGHGAEDGQEER